MPLVNAVHACWLNSVLDAAGERRPCLLAEREAAAVGISGIADGTGWSGLGDFDALAAGIAVAGLAPWPGQFRVLRDGHRVSFASALIIPAESAGLRAWVTRWVQVRMNWPTSSPASTYTSPISPSTWASGGSSGWGKARSANFPSMPALAPAANGKARMVTSGRSPASM